MWVVCLCSSPCFAASFRCSCNFCFYCFTGSLPGNEKRARSDWDTWLRLCLLILRGHRKWYLLCLAVKMSFQKHALWPARKELVWMNTCRCLCGFISLCKFGVSGGREEMSASPATLFTGPVTVNVQSCDSACSPVTVSMQSCDCQHAVLWLSACSHMTVSMQSYDCQHTVQSYDCQHTVQSYDCQHTVQSYDCQHTVQSYDCQHTVLLLSTHSPVTVSTQSYDCQHAVLWLSARSLMIVSTQSYDCQHAVLWMSARSPVTVSMQSAWFPV